MSALVLIVFLAYLLLLCTDAGEDILQAIADRIRGQHKDGDQ